MKLLSTWAAFLLFVFALLAAADACQPFKTFARTALDISQSVCIVANADKSDAEVKAICNVLDALDDPMRELLKTSREQAAIARDRAAFSADVKCHFEKLQGDAGAFKDGGR